MCSFKCFIHRISLNPQRPAQGCTASMWQTRFKVKPVLLTYTKWHTKNETYICWETNCTVGQKIRLFLLGGKTVSPWRGFLYSFSLWDTKKKDFIYKHDSCHNKCHTTLKNSKFLNSWIDPFCSSGSHFLRILMNCPPAEFLSKAWHQRGIKTWKRISGSESLRKNELIIK